MSSQNERSYDNIASQFAFDRSYAKINHLVVKFADLLNRGDSVLDVGCGTGVPNYKYLDERGMKVTGIDISAKLLEIAKKNIPKGEFIKVNIVKFQTTKRFEGIIAWDSLFHLNLDEHKKVFRKLYDLLSKGGYLVFTHGGGSGGEIFGEMFDNHFTYSALGPVETKKYLKKLGFKILDWKVEKEGNGYMLGLIQKI